MTGHYEGGGYRWRPERPPICWICRQPAVYITPELDLALCDRSECHSAYVRTGHKIEFIKNEEKSGNILYQGK